MFLEKNKKLRKDEAFVWEISRPVGREGGDFFSFLLFSSRGEKKGNKQKEKNENRATTNKLEHKTPSIDELPRHY